jgi:hypothetical protein
VSSVAVVLVSRRIRTTAGQRRIALCGAGAPICRRKRVSKARSSTVTFLGEGGDQDARADFIPLPRALLVIHLYLSKIRRMSRLRVDLAARVRVPVVADHLAILFASAKSSEDAGYARLAALRLSIYDTLFRWKIVERRNEKTIGSCDAGWVLLRDFQV